MLKGRGKPMARLLVSDSSVNGDTAVEGGDRLARLTGSVEMTSGDSAKTMAPETGEPTAFISYSRKDITFVDRLEPALKTRGVDARVDRETSRRARNGGSESSSSSPRLTPSSLC
jgi:hypothetical protein